MNRLHLSVVTALFALAAMSATRAARAQYTLWPEQPAAQVPARARDVAPSPEPVSPPHFGGARTLLVSASGGVSTSTVNSAEGVATFALDYFFHERISLGVELWGSTFTYRGDGVEAYGFGPRAGYAIPLGRVLSVYPTLGLIYSEMNLSSRISTGTDPKHRGLSLSLDIPILLHVTPGTVAGVGLALRQDLTNYNVDPVYQTDRPNVGGFLTFGGWLPLGESIPPEASSYNHLPI
jgi:hypothetical protein